MAPAKTAKVKMPHFIY